MHGAFGYNAMALQLGLKVLLRYLLFYPVLKVDKPGEPSVEGDVLEHPLGIRRCFGFNGLAFRARQLAIKGSAEHATKLRFQWICFPRLSTRHLRMIGRR
jgi:hypothetical protein